jgi:hypothetical protein
MKSNDKSDNITLTKLMSWISLAYYSNEEINDMKFTSDDNQIMIAQIIEVYIVYVTYYRSHKI